MKDINTILDVKIEKFDMSLRQVMREMLADLMVEGECFSGKRPAGFDSGWECDIAQALVKSGHLKGKLLYADHDTVEYTYEWSDYTKLIMQAVDLLTK